MKPDIEELRKKYMDNPPEGMSSRDIRRMSEEEHAKLKGVLIEMGLLH